MKKDKKNNYGVRTQDEEKEIYREHLKNKNKDKLKQIRKESKWN
jgi:hypothetical protein